MNPAIVFLCALVILAIWFLGFKTGQADAGKTDWECYVAIPSILLIIISAITAFIFLGRMIAFTLNTATP